MKGIFSVICVCFYTLTANAQHVKRLHVGDTMPPTILRMINYKDSSLNTADLKKPLTILSFWTPACSFSPGQLPVLYNLQQQFADGLYVLPVGFDGRQEGAVREYIEARKGSADEVKIPSAVQYLHDSLLYKMLPYMGLPQNVWMDSNHVILAITDHYSLTAEHISEGIAGHLPPLELKNYDYGFDASEPLLKHTLKNDTPLYYSMITPYQPDIILDETQERNERYTRIATGNVTPLGLLQSAISGIDSTGRLPVYDPMNKRLLNLVTENELFDTPYYSLPRSEYAKAEALRRKQSFCYEVMMPGQFDYHDAYRKMLADVTGYFKVQAGIEPRMMNTLSITVKRKEDIEPSREGEEDIAVNPKLLTFSFVHCTPGRVAEVLNNILTLPVITDDTGMKAFMNLSFRLSSLTDEEGLQRALQTAGLEIQKRKASINMMVIRNR